MIQYLRILIFFLVNLSMLGAQNTVGLLSYHPARAFNGYNLIYPHSQPNVYLFDNCGEIVHVWTDTVGYVPGNTAYLLPDGNLVKTKRPAAVAGNPIWAGGGGAIIEIRDWDNNLLWQFEQNDAVARLHHDIEVLPSGNILAIMWEAKTVQECIDAGRDSSLLTDEVLWPDAIIEIEPYTGNIVWKWHVWDHLVQDFDATKANYGVVADHPELIDFNYDTTNGDADWLHSNALDYHPGNDMIMMSVPTFSELWVIDHSTTTAQAAGHVGGFGGRGGDLLFRWGNPAAYRAGTAADQKLFYQHDTNWALDFLDFTHPHYGKIAVFNNRVGADYSAANLINPPFDMYTWSFPMQNGAFLPADYDLTINHPDPQRIYSTGLSSIQVLPNGNFLICAGRWGYSFEITPDGDIVWEYITPLSSGMPVEQGQTINIAQNNTFRVFRYPAGYPAFSGKDLSSKGWIELNPDTTLCALLLPVNTVPDRYGLKLYPNPADERVTIEWKEGVQVTIEIFNLLGHKKATMQLDSGRKYLDTRTWEKGVYFVQINGVEIQRLLIQHE
ncbi:MAG: T9SS type A sorting domain-containing protein [Bacteroidetes bacterium]|nr:MAG: T9SS type A sorting domain-containing protein [Bacteroidota bacterium]